MSDAGISRAMLLLSEQAILLEEEAEESVKFTAVVASVTRNKFTITLSVKYCTRDGGITLCMRLWEPVLNMVPMVYSQQYEELIKKIFAELLKFALEGDFQSLEEVRKVLVLESN